MKIPLYLKDSYQKTLHAKIVSVVQKGKIVEVVLSETIFYPEGGGQPCDRGEIRGEKGSLKVDLVKLRGIAVIHQGKLSGNLKKGDRAVLRIDWVRRFDNMRWHSAGHVLHEIVMETVPGLIPVRGEHGKHAYIEYQGWINPKLLETLEKKTNLLVASDRRLSTQFVSLSELKKQATWVPEHLPSSKPLRILQIAGYPPIPDGGTQVKNTSEIGHVRVLEIENVGDFTKVYYSVEDIPQEVEIKVRDDSKQLQPIWSLGLDTFRALLIELQEEVLHRISEVKTSEVEDLKVSYFGKNGHATQLIKRIKDLSPHERKAAGMLINEIKRSLELAFSQRMDTLPSQSIDKDWFDVSLPGIKPPQGHLHIVTQAITEITRIFERIGFTRVRHPEVDWDWYAFESLNMPPNHPARDEWETFFVEYPGKPGKDPKKQQIVLTPHTSNGQVREMEKEKLPIRMINIAKCYRRQSDVSHSPMFHQFEGLYIDRMVSIGHLKGVMDYFFKQFYGLERKSRLRPFHFQFTEPSFEVDINCGICLGSAQLPSGEPCKLCKAGWLELGGAGMVHPVVLRNGGVDPEKYSGFAFGWGVERAFMMKTGTKIDDVRLIYSSDLRFLDQF